MRVPLRTQTFLTFKRTRNGEWKVLQHVDCWDLRWWLVGTIGSVVDLVTRALGGKDGFGIVERLWEVGQNVSGTLSSRAVELTQGKLNQRKVAKTA
jgi:hypothetical protein